MWKLAIAITFIVLGAVALLAVIGFGIYALMVWLGAPKWAAAGTALLVLAIGGIANRK